MELNSSRHTHTHTHTRAQAPARPRARPPRPAPLCTAAVACLHSGPRRPKRGALSPGSGTRGTRSPRPPGRGWRLQTRRAQGRKGGGGVKPPRLVRGSNEAASCAATQLLLRGGASHPASKQRGDPPSTHPPTHRLQFGRSPKCPGSTLPDQSLGTKAGFAGGSGRPRGRHASRNAFGSGRAWAAVMHEPPPAVRRNAAHPKRTQSVTSAKQAAAASKMSQG
jgi:hypothetical protein